MWCSLHPRRLVQTEGKVLKAIVSPVVVHSSESCHHHPPALQRLTTAQTLNVQVVFGFLAFFIFAMLKEVCDKLQFIKQKLLFHDILKSCPMNFLLIFFYYTDLLEPKLPQQLSSCAFHSQTYWLKFASWLRLVTINQSAILYHLGGHKPH